MGNVLVGDCETGGSVERPLTSEEQAALDAAHADAEAQRVADQWQTVDSVRGQQLRDTDWMIEPFPADIPPAIESAIKANEQGWYGFRDGLRAITHDGDPTALVWPTPPAAPTIVITSPPEFVDWSAWPPEHVPTP